METELKKISGTVEDVVFHNEDTGFTVMTVSVDDILITVVGETSAIGEGEEITAQGDYANHHTYGQQFKAQLIQRSLPSTANAILKYLSAGSVKGIGPSTAKKIVSVFGDKTMDIMENQPQRLSEIRGITEKKAEQIGAEYQRLYGVRKLMLFLSDFNVQPAKAILAWKKWGADALDLLTTDPYLLCSEPIFIDFAIADAMGEQFNLSPESYRRIKAGVLFSLRHNSFSGHVCLPMKKTLSITSQFLDVSEDLIADALEEMYEDSSINILKVNDSEFVYLVEFYNAEHYVAGRASLMLQFQSPNAAENAKKLGKDITKLELEYEIEYHDLQKKAIATAVTSNIFILTGGPGTGKTTTVNGILYLLEQQGMKVALAAPTGRAAKRMSEVTGKEAKTLHRLLEVEPTADGLAFKRNEKNPLPADVIIIDEMSMVDIVIMEHLIRGIKMTAKLILVGDCDQLPSVSAGNVLKDMIDSDVIPTVHLSQIFRQAAESLIVTNAHSIVAGELPNLSVKDKDFFFLPKPDPTQLQQLTVDLCCNRLPKSYGYSPMWDIQIIVPGKQGPAGTIELNRQMQATMNPPEKSKTQANFMGRILRDGDKVMQIRNNYDIICKTDDGQEVMGIFNGDIGQIEMMDNGSKTIKVRYDDKVAAYTYDDAEQLELAYAITIHKSQGSEFEAVVMPLGNKHPMLHYRNLLYTGVTRAKQILILAGNKNTVAEMVHNNRRTLRYTNLKDIIKSSVISLEV